MKKRVCLLLVLVLVVLLAATSCGEKTITKLEVVNLTDVLSEIGEIKVDDDPDFSDIVVRVSYSDGSFSAITAEDGLVIEKPDTSVGGKVTVNFSYKGAEGSFEIDVTARTLVSLEIDESTIAKEVIVGEVDRYDISSLKVTATYSDGTKKVLSEGEYDYELPDVKKSGTKKLIISVGNVSDSVDVKVKAENSIFADTENVNTTILAGETLDFSGLVVKLLYSDGTNKVLTADEYTTNLASLDLTTGGEKKVVVTYGEYEDEFTVFVKVPTAIVVDASALNTTVMAGDALDLSALIVKVKYNDNSEETLTADDYTTNLASLDLTAGGEKTVVVTYGDFTDDFKIFVKKAIAIEVDATAVNKVVMTKDELDLLALVVTLKYNDNSTVALTAADYTTNIDSVDFTTGGAKQVVVTYGSFTDSFDITVKKATGIIVNADAVNKTIMAGGTLDLSGLVVSVKYNVGANETLSASDYTTNLASLDLAAGGSKKVVVSYGAFTAEFDIFVKVATGIELDAEGVETDLTIEQELDYSALKVYLVYNSGERELLTEGYTAVEENRNDAATRKLVVTYGDFSAELKVLPATLESLTYELASNYIRVLTGGTPDFSKFTVTAVYSNGSKKVLDNSLVTFEADTNPNEGYGQVDVTISYEGVSAVAEKKVMVYKPLDINVVEGTAFTNKVKIDAVGSYSIDALEIQIVYTDGVMVYFDKNDYTTNFAELDFTTPGIKTLTVTGDHWTRDIEIEVIGVASLEVISGIDTELKDGEALDLSNILVKVTYSDGTSKNVGLSAITTNVSELDLTTAGEKALKVAYFNGETTVTFKVVLVSSLEVIAGIKSEYKDETPDFSGVQIKATYTDGSTKMLTLADVTTNISALDFTTAGDKAIVIGYNGAEVTVTVKVVTLDSAKIENLPEKVVLPDEADLSGIKVTLVYSDGTTKVITNYTTNIAELDFATVGTKTVKVTYNGRSFEKAIEVVAVSTVVIDPSSVPANVYKGDALDLSGIKVTVTYTDGSSEVIGLAQLEGTSFDSSVIGDANLTVTYRGVTSSPVVIKVTEKILIGSIALPDAIVNSTESYKKNFKVSTNNYKIGHDNALQILLNLTAYDTSTTPPTPLPQPEYIGKTTVYLVGESGETEVGATYVSVDENAHTVDFTNAAIGKTFRIVFGVQGTNKTAELTVDVVDAYNVTNAKELNFITNSGSFTGRKDNVPSGEEETRYNAAVVDKFLAANNMVRPANLNGIVIHGNINITANDLPADYFINYTDANGVAQSDFYDHFEAYVHDIPYDRTEGVKNTFGIYGNYFTVYSYQLPNVAQTGIGNNGDGVSNSPLFLLSGTLAVQENLIPAEEYDFTKMEYNIEDIAFQDNDPNVDDETVTERSMRGLICLKTRMSVANIINTNIQRYFISHLVDSDYHTANIINSKYFNAWQGHVFVWADNMYARQRGEHDIEPLANHVPVTTNIISSDLTKCGGPVVMLQHPHQDPNDLMKANNNSGPILNVDAASNLETWVTGQESWFAAYGATAYATQIASLSALFEGYAPMYGTSATFAPNDKSITGIEQPAINIQVLVMRDGLGVGEAIDIDGKVTVAGNELVNFMDKGGVDNGENPELIKYLTATGGQAPVFRSSAGGWCFFDGTQSLFGLDTGAPGNPNPTCFAGDYLTLYYLGMGIVLEFMHP